MSDELPVPVREPDWVKYAVWWQIFPLGFVGAETASAGVSVTHRLGRVIDWLDHAVELGVSGLALGPVFAASTHGYDTIDYFLIDPRLGDDEDFAALVDAAHGRGLRVILDGVFNHVGREFPAFRRVLAEGPSAAEANWFRLTWPNGPDAEPDYAKFEGHDQLVELNHDEPAVAELVGDVMCHWLAAGVDGWRLDAAYAVPPEFWSRVLPRVRERFPGAYIFGEVIHGDYAGIVRDSGMDSVTQYELWKAIWSSINDGNLFELTWALKRHVEMLDSFVPLTFVGNHDVTRIASMIDDEHHLPHALALLLTVAGTPSIYYGDEQGYRGIKEDRVGGDDAVRPEFPAEAGAVAAGPGAETYRLHHELIGLRRRNPWLHSARSIPLHLTNTALVLETTGEGSRLVTVLNLSDSAETFKVPGVANALAGSATIDGTFVTIPPHGWGVLD